MFASYHEKKMKKYKKNKKTIKFCPREFFLTSMDIFSLELCPKAQWTFINGLF